MLALNRNYYRFLIFALTLILVIFFSLPLVNSKPVKKLKLQEWQINGILAALDDGYDRVKGYGFTDLAEYKSAELKTALQQPEEVARKAVSMIKNEKVDPYVRVDAFKVFAKLGEYGAEYFPEIFNFMNTENSSILFQRDLADGLNNLGARRAEYSPDVLK